MTVTERVAQAREQIEQAAAAAGVSAGSIALVAATKTNTAQTVREAIAAGVSACGENRVQEMTEKLSQGAYQGAPLHFIGHLQKNKVNKVVGACDLIQSVDSQELMRLVSARALTLGIRQDILIEINIGGEEAKSGISPQELPRLLNFSEEQTGICVRGLMTIPPKQEKTGQNLKYFEAMYKLFVDITAKKYDNSCVDILSMGMSEDYIDAIRAGANMIRLGSALFGPRV